ncbi:MAG TPA: DUF4260 domain-containing protein [Candidatus Limnocylindrales bacterium]|jgi:hypothetical protein|nr:DUF4260 domain-containing protein [Candidatus Limnocylindrales bacterium]
MTAATMQLEASAQATGQAATSGVSASPRSVTTVLRIEGLAGFVAGLAVFGALGGSWLLALPLLFLPDLAMVGYLRDARVGAVTYNLVHNWAIGLVVLGLGLWSGVAAIAITGAILVAHTGMDRALGYGLKYPTSFRDTHLGRIGRNGR